MSQLKQRFLCANSPKPPNFDQERTRQFERLLTLISTTDRAKWLSTGFNCGPMIESYKQVYGMTSQQFETVLSLLINIAFKEKGLSTDIRAYILKLLNSMSQYQIKITNNFSISNIKLLKYLQGLVEGGVDGNLKHSDALIEDLSKFVLFFSRFGQDVVEQALQMAVNFNDIRYLAIFLRSIKSEQVAQRLLTELFSDNNLWDRDCSWFYILGQVSRKFPKLDYSKYYQTIMQEVIRTFTTLINSDNEESIKKITSGDNYLQIPAVLNSVALILAFLLLPEHRPQHVFIKSCIERLFSLITGSLDVINPPEYLNQMLTFLKSFARFFLLRYRGQRGLFKLYNQDAIEDYHEPKDDPKMIDQSAEEFFDSLWPDIIPRLVYYEDPQSCRPSKIITDLSMYKPEKFLALSLASIMNVVGRGDPTLVSFHGCKISLLFLQEFIMVDQPEHLPQYFQCLEKMIGHLENLGIPENIDMLELFFRSFLFLTNSQLEQHYVQSMVDDTLTMILDILEPMAISLDDADDDQAELYVDFANIFLPFFVRLDEEQISRFGEKFLYRLANQVPEHTQVYEYLSIALTLIDDSFAHKVFKIIKSKLLTQETEDSKKIQYEFLPKTHASLYLTNETVLKWYGSLLQCIFQYHPKNIVKHWKDIQAIMIVLFREWENQIYLELGLDILYNIVLCLCKPEFSWKEFSKAENFRYDTLNIHYEKLSKEVVDLIDYLYQTYFENIKKYLENRYSKSLLNGNQGSALSDFENYYEQNMDNDILRIRKRNLKLVDYVLMPKISGADDVYDKKIIYRALSIQYTITSAMMYRLPFHSKMENIGDFLTDEKFINMRPRLCKYLEWVMQVLGHYGMFSEDQCVKLFNFFWRQSHDEVCYTAPVEATNDKLSPFYYSQMYRKKQLLRSAYLIVNEAYLNHMTRLGFHLLTEPTSHINNERYLQSNFILGLSPTYEPSLHSYFPTYVEVHQYHRQLMAILRYHLNPSNSKGYLAIYLKEEDEATKERYSSAIRYMLISLKRLLNIFSDQCCMRDQFVRNTIFQIVSLYKLLPKKNEKSLIYQMIYVMLVFSFDANTCRNYEQYSLKKYWQLKLEGSPETQNYEMASAQKGFNIEKVIEGITKEEEKVIDQIDLIRGLKLTRSCSFQNDSDLEKQLERAVCYLLKKLEDSVGRPEKDVGVYLLMLLLYSNALSIQNPLIGRLITLLAALCQQEYSQLFEMSKTGFFHIINRFNYNQRIKTEIENTPVKRTWENFLRFKYIGGENIDYEKARIQKNQQNFYPTPKLIMNTYKELASDSSSPSFRNEKILFEILKDQSIMLKFLKNCSLDPELKQSDQGAFMVSEQSIKSVSAGAHKLMHFIWDGNPSKTPLFMGMLERYSSSPLNIYNRMFRKIIRFSNEETKKVCYDLAQKLRKSDEQQMIRLSAYISCQLLMRNPNSPNNQPFINFLGQCTKENFDYVLMGFYGIFTSNFISGQKSYDLVLQTLRSLKGAPRLRHLELSNTYIIAQGRFARKAAYQMNTMFMKGIEEGADEISEAIVSMITECWVQAVNLKILDQWVEEPLQELIDNQKIFILNEHVAYNHESILISLLSELMRKAKEQDEHSSSVRLYSQIVRKLLASINIYRFNSYFFKLLRQALFYVIERPQSIDDDSSDIAVTTQLCDSEYPEDIYQEILARLVPMTDRTLFVVKKKLMFIQGMIINRTFRFNKVDLPQLLELNEKQLTLDFIVTLSNMMRLMKNDELTEEVNRILKITNQRPKFETYTLIALLMAAGVREFEWREAILRDLMKHKKDKLIKEGISEWWKGKTPETEQENRLSDLVRNFENPYSYFA